MKKNLKKPMKSLMLTAMALLTATATAVNASSYSFSSTVRVEHIWDDNNNADNTRPTEVVDTIIQTETKKDENGENVTTTRDKNYGQLNDKGETGGKEAGVDAGYQAGVQAGKDAAASIEKGEAQEVEGVKEEEFKKPEKPEVPEEPVEKLPDGVEETEDPGKFEETEPDPEQYGSNEEYQEAKAEYDQKFSEYNERSEAYKKYQEYLNSDEYKKFKEEYDKYLEYRESEQYEKDQEALDTYYDAYDAYLEAIAKLGNKKFETPEGLPEDDPRFNDAFIRGYQAAIAGGYEEAFLKGFMDSFKETVETPPVISADERTEYVNKITEALKNRGDASSEGTAEDEAKIAARAEEIMARVEAMLKDGVIGNQWAEEKNDCQGSTDATDTNGPAGTPINYDAAILDQATLDALQNAGKDKGYDGYETVKMQVKVTLVAGDDGVQRVYVSVDGGTNWTPGDETTANWDKTNQTTYDPTTEYVQETVITFLHTLVKPEDPKDPPRDSKDPKDPETPILEEEVPLTNVEEPQEEIPEEEVPLTDVPKTGDNSLLWMCAAMFSGTALLALLKKEKEAQEA